MFLWILQKLTVVTAKAESFMPTQGTEIAKGVDNLYGFFISNQFLVLRDRYRWNDILCNKV
jgi:hypothetical protein